MDRSPTRTQHSTLEKQRAGNLDGTVRGFPHSVPVGNNGRIEGKEKERVGKGTDERWWDLGGGQLDGRSAASGNKTKKESRAESWAKTTFDEHLPRNCHDSVASQPGLYTGVPVCLPLRCPERLDNHVVNAKAPVCQSPTSPSSTQEPGLYTGVPVCLSSTSTSSTKRPAPLQRIRF
ncbi:hypothetical protein HPB47_018394 [Ixodes persulcatus]|uniref:Uncharacterized protein n=1 Tax=Ixodes persulcatus TaxID=34615 RepID=A0AC60QKT9_IXOPE|nr:hypothetical protein HPB47_018394 [Ixodes persulcatus]